MHMRLNARILAILTIGLCGSAMPELAGAQITNLMPLVDISETGSLKTVSFTCDEMANVALDCTFVFTQVAPKQSVHEKEVREENIDGYESELEEVRNYLNKMCEPLRELGQREIEQRFDELQGKTNSEYLGAQFRVFSEYCSAVIKPETYTQEVRIRIAAEMDRLNSRTCEVTTQVQSMKLESTGENTWALTNGPYGWECGRLDVTTLERDQSAVNPWMVSQRTIYTGESEECSDMIETTRVYEESLYNETIDLSCDFIAVDWLTTQFVR